ncbi:MAG: hypothetical protein P1U65_10405 [Minwuia sp.]|nr:hypothetical protein [Minwuia sp.]
MRGYPKAGSADVLFVTYGGGHVTMVVPVARELKRRGIRVTILALTTAIAVVDAAGLDYFTFADLPAAQTEAVQAEGTRLAAEFPSGGPLPTAETVAYLGINYLDLEETLGKENAAALWRDGGRQNFRPRTTMRRVIEDVSPRLVVTTNSPRTERTAVEEAGTLGVPSVVMVDLFALQEVAWLSSPSFGEELYVLNDAVRNMMVKHGRPPEDVIITGNPAFDAIRHPDSITAGIKLRSERGWGGNGRTSLLYASSPEPKFNPFAREPADTSLPVKIEHQLRSITERHQNYDLIIRRHPSESSHVDTNERVFQSPRSEDITALLHAVDQVVVTTSSVGLQAYLAGRQVFSVQGAVFSRDSPYSDYGMATEIPSIDQIEGIIFNKNSNTATKIENFPQEPAAINATQAISDNICKFI